MSNCSCPVICGQKINILVKIVGALEAPRFAEPGREALRVGLVRFGGYRFGYRFGAGIVSVRFGPVLPSYGVGRLVSALVGPNATILAQRIVIVLTNVVFERNNCQHTGMTDMVV